MSPGDLGPSTHRWELLEAKHPHLLYLPLARAAAFSELYGCSCLISTWFLFQRWAVASHGESTGTTLRLQPLGLPPRIFLPYGWFAITCHFTYRAYYRAKWPSGFSCRSRADRFSFLRHGGRAGAARMSVRQQHLAKVSTSMPHIRVLARRISRSSCFSSAFCLGISGSGL